MIARLFPALTIIFLASSIGCSQFVPAEGTVTLNGELLDGATVTFIPEKIGRGSQGTELAGPTLKGKFQMFTKDKPGVRPGSYKVTVSKMAIKFKEGGLVESTMELLPREYTNADKTPLSVEIPEGGRTDILLEAKGELKSLPTE